MHGTAFDETAFYAAIGRHVSDLMSTNRFAARAKDVEGIRLLEALGRALGE